MANGGLFPRLRPNLATCLFLKLPDRNHLGSLNNCKTKKTRLDKRLAVPSWHRGGGCCCQRGVPGG